MASIRTLTTFALALGVAANPAPAPQPEAEAGIADSIGPVAVKLEPVSVSLTLPNVELPTPPAVNAARGVPNIDLPVLPTTLLSVPALNLPRGLTTPTLAPPALPALPTMSVDVAIPASTISLAIEVPDLNIPRGLTAPTLAPPALPALPTLSVDVAVPASTVSIAVEVPDLNIPRDLPILSSILSLSVKVEATGLPGLPAGNIPREIPALPSISVELPVLPSTSISLPLRRHARDISIANPPLPTLPAVQVAPYTVVLPGVVVPNVPGVVVGRDIPAITGLPVDVSLPTAAPKLNLERDLPAVDVMILSSLLATLPTATPKVLERDLPIDASSVLSSILATLPSPLAKVNLERDLPIDASAVISSLLAALPTPPSKLLEREIAIPLPTVAHVTFSLTDPVVLPAPVLPAVPRDIVPTSVDRPVVPTLPAISPVNVKGEPINAKVLPLRALPVLPINPTTLIALIPAPTGILSCSTVQCIPDYICKEKNGAPICVPASPPTVPVV